MSVEGIWLQTEHDVIHLKYVTGVRVRQQIPIPDGKWDLQAVLVSYFGPVVIDEFETQEDALLAKAWFHECMSSDWLDMDDWNAGRTDASKRQALRAHIDAQVNRKASSR